MSISPTMEGFRAAFRRPSLTLAEISWRWMTGATAFALFLFGLSEYLRTLPVTNGELLFLRTRHPYLVGEAIAHILRGSLNRVVLTGLVGTMLLGALWMVAAALGRVATVRGLFDYFRRDHDAEAATADAGKSAFRALIRLNFLRAAVALAAVLGLVGAGILAGFASSDAHPRPGVVLLLFAPLAALVCLAWWVLNWMLSLSGIFAVREGRDVMAAISGALDFCRDRAGAIFAVSTWTGFAHLVLLVSAWTVIAMPMGLIAVVQWRLVALVVAFLLLIYFALADWLYMVRLAGYVCILEMPKAFIAAAIPDVTQSGGESGGVAVQTSIDRDEPILSDLPNSGDGV